MSSDSRPVQPTLSAVVSGFEADPLIARAQRGDAAALNTLVRAEIPRVERLLLRILGPRADLADLVQTVFLELCRALPSFRGESSFSTFVGGISVCVARRAMRPTSWLSRRRSMPEYVADDSPAPDRTVDLSEGMRACQRALAQLSTDKRVAFTLWAFEGLDMATIAQMTGASVSATRSRVFYAQKELRKRAASDPWLRQLVGGDDDGRA